MNIRTKVALAMAAGLAISATASGSDKNIGGRYTATGMTPGWDGEVAFTATLFIDRPKADLWFNLHPTKNIDRVELNTLIDEDGLLRIRRTSGESDFWRIREDEVRHFLIRNGGDLLVCKDCEGEKDGVPIRWRRITHDAEGEYSAEPRTLSDGTKVGLQLIVNQETARLLFSGPDKVHEVDSKVTLVGGPDQFRIELPKADGGVTFHVESGGDSLRCPNCPSYQLPREWKANSAQ